MLKIIYAAMYGGCFGYAIVKLFQSGDSVMAVLAIGLYFGLLYIVVCVKRIK